MTREHTGLKILGIISLVAGILMVIGGLFYLSLGSAVAGAGDDDILGILAFTAGLAVAASGAVILVIGAILAFLGYNVYKHNRWAYWLYFILTIIGFIGSLIGVSWFGILIGGLIIYYLWTIRKSFMAGADIRRTWR